MALDAAEQSSKAKTVFLNNMSHDIRTPMNAILGFTTLAKEHYDDKDKLKDYLNKIDISSKHLLSLINDVLDMSKIESGRVKIQEEEVDILDMFDELKDILLPDLNYKNIDYTVDTSELNDRKVICDRLRLKQILLNILSNAVKFTNENGSIHVSIEENEDFSKDKPTFVISVKDNGIGMSEEFKQHIFEAFSRERSSTISGIQGTGLGMAITKSLVDMMNGTISVNSKVGLGSEFIVTLQLEVVHDETNNEIKDTDVTSNNENLFVGKSILLVEDNLLNQEIAKEILKETGFNVDVASDGDIAISKVENMKDDDYDIILMDVQMPKMDGYTATKKIRSLDNEKAKNIPIIAVTANAFNEDKNKAIEAGMNGHIAKPLNLNELFNVLKDTLNK